VALSEDLSKAAKARPAWRNDRMFMLVFLLGGFAIVVVDVLTVFHDRAAAGRPVPIWEPGVWELSSWLILALLAPACGSPAAIRPCHPRPSAGSPGICPPA
jgi:hypothetical protein